MSVVIHVPKRDGSYRQVCGCGARMDALRVFDPDNPVLEQAQIDFMNKHSGAGHSGVTEFYVQGQWIVGGSWSPLTAADHATIDAMGGFK